MNNKRNIDHLKSLPVFSFNRVKAHSNSSSVRIPSLHSRSKYQCAFSILYGKVGLSLSLTIFNLPSSEQIGKVGSHTDDDSYCVELDTGHKFSARKFGSLVILNFEGVKFSKDGYNLHYSDLPYKYRPSASRNGHVSVADTVRLMSVTGQHIYVYGAGDSYDQGIYGSIAYYVD